MNRIYKKGLTIVELCVYVIVFALFLGMASGVFFWARKSVDVSEKIDELQDLRMAAIQINNELSYGNRILFPPLDNKTYHQILLKNNKNELIVFFRDKDFRLLRLNYEKYKRGEPRGLWVISRNAIDFEVERTDNDLLKYSVRITDENKIENVIANAGKMINTETNEPW
ncbi:MAG: hypothetical protein ACQETH_05545 [Candidatus Rifleibacteriota bacterium]